MRTRSPVHAMSFRRFGALTVCVASVLLAGCGKKDDRAEVARPASKPTAQQIERFDDLTIQLIMQGPGLIGTSPSNVSYAADGKKLFFQWNDPSSLDSLNAISPLSAYDNFLKLEDELSYYELDIATGTIRKLDEIESDGRVPLEHAWNRQRTRRVEIRGGDVYLVELSSDRDRVETVRRITATLAAEANVQMTPEGDEVFFVANDNVFSVSWSGGPIRQLTDIRVADDPEDEAESDQRTFLMDQQEELFEEVKRKKKKPEKRHPLPVYIGNGWTIANVLVSPSGSFAALGISKSAAGAREPVVPHFVTESGYVETTETRSKVNDAQETVRVRMIDIEKASLVPIDIDDAIIPTPMSWSPTTDMLLLRGIVENYKSRYFYVVEPQRPNEKGVLIPKQLDHYADAAWVGGPNFYKTGGWLRDGSGIFFVSEEEGFSHLYTVALDGRLSRLTSGDWEVHLAHPSLDGSRWYLVTNEGDAGTRRLWAMKADGSERRLLTPDLGAFVPHFSPNESTISLLHSTVSAPPELYVLHVSDSRIDGPLTQSTTELFRKFAWVWPELVHVPASDGERFPAQLFRPEVFGKKPNGAGVIFIHGAGYTQNAKWFWPYYYREYMFNNFLAFNGYTVANLDFRGSAGYGRDVRVAIHEHMGGRDLDDVIDCAKYLVRREKVKKERVGVYGGSYGGFLTLMALFKYPDDIACGGAIRSVTDWAHYNHWYTSRILGTPQENPDAYRRSSPIYFADGLEGDLLMLHGLVDANVLAQDILRLSQRLIELGKEDWELALYPVEPHSFKRASSWTDEYKRIYKLFESILVGR